MTTTIERRRNKEALKPEEKRAFKKWVDSFPTLLDAYTELGVTHVTLNKVLLVGTGHPDTIAKIRAKIGG